MLTRIALALAFTAGAGLAQTASLTELLGVSGARPSGVSADGQWIAGGTGDVMKWSQASGSWANLGAGTSTSARVSDDGRYVSANLPDPANGNASTAARYDSVSGQWTIIGGLASQSGTSKSTAYDMSGDGQTVVGLGWVTAGEAHAFKWTASGGVVDLQPTFGMSSRANGISSDGQAAVGWIDNNRRGARWKNGVLTTLGSLDPANPVFGGSEAFGANHDGSIVVGTSYNSGYRWTETGGLENLGKLPGAATCQLVAISDDGETAVGWSGTNFLDAQAVIWRPEFGSSVLYLGDVLVAAGENNAALWTLRIASDVSADGTVIPCWGVSPPSFTAHPFRVVLPRTPTAYCTAGTTTNGCVPSISTATQPSASFAVPSVVTVSNVEGNRNGLLFFSVTGQNNVPWGLGSTSYFCVKTPTMRTTLQNSGGTNGQCDGVLSLDWNAFRQTNPGGLGAPWAAGQKVWFQGWFRDPPAPRSTNLSNGLEMIHSL